MSSFCGTNTIERPAASLSNDTVSSLYESDHECVAKCLDASEWMWKMNYFIIYFILVFDGEMKGYCTTCGWGGAAVIFTPKHHICRTHLQRHLLELSADILADGHQHKS